MAKIKRSTQRGKRGQALEKLIEYSAKQYLVKGKARIDKIPTPMTQYRGKVWRERSTVDFSGTIQGGRSVDFDAKATQEKTRFEICNETHIAPHQIEYLKQKHQLGGIAFLLVEFTTLNEHYIIPYPAIEKFIERGHAGGRKSIAYNEFNIETGIIPIGPGPGIALDFLEPYI